MPQVVPFRWPEWSLSRWPRALLPVFKSNEEKNAFEDKARKTIGAINELQQSADLFLAAAQKFQSLSSYKQSIPEPMHEAYEASRKMKWQKQNWSDGFMYFSSLSDADIKVPMNAVFGMIPALGALCLLGLARKRPIRGGIEIAWGVELQPGELYGCAVAKAYELESEIAQYPRIVLGPYIVDYLQKMDANTSNSIFDKANQKLAKVCIEMLAEDMDGRFFVDYLGSGFPRLIEKDRHRLLYDEAHKFIEEQLAKHRIENNTKLVLRYHHLLQYFVDHHPDNTLPSGS